jgi:vacuolar-type H+-ATPase subunit I/STV1
MTSEKKSERDYPTSILEEHRRSTAKELDKIRDIESEKRQKLTMAQDELDATQEMLDKNAS